MVAPETTMHLHILHSDRTVFYAVPLFIPSPLPAAWYNSLRLTSSATPARNLARAGDVRAVLSGEPAWSSVPRPLISKIIMEVFETVFVNVTVEK